VRTRQVNGPSGTPLLDVVCPAHLEPGPAPIGRPLRTSRLAVLRVDTGRVIVESPLAAARVVVRHLGVAALVAALAEPALPADRAVPGLDPADLVEAAGWLAGVGVLVRPDAEDADPVLAVREPHDVWFHASTRAGHAPGRLGATGRLAGSPVGPPPALADRSVTGWQALAPPPAGGTGPGLYAVLDARRSRRGFGPVDVQRLGELLWRTLRVRQRVTSGALELTRRPVPSGGGTADIEAFVAVGQCAGLAAGLWCYDPAGHRLGQLPAPPAQAARLLLGAGAAMEAAAPPVLLLLSARFARTAWKYEGIAYSLTLKHAGIVMATVVLLAEALGLAACPLGTGDSALFERLAGTHPLAESTVGEIALGGRV
jgi:oxazoline/thiazoline dehydrogenase